MKLVSLFKCRICDSVDRGPDPVEVPDGTDPSETIRKLLETWLPEPIPHRCPGGNIVGVAPFVGLESLHSED